LGLLIQGLRQSPHASLINETCFGHLKKKLSNACVPGNFMAGKFYTLTTGANERRWEKMKDKLQMVIDSFEIFNV
jgi:hypothetical protein